MTLRVGICGLGKLGGPVAVAIARKFSVIGYDVDPEKMKKRKWPELETGPDGIEEFQPYLDKSTLQYANHIKPLVDNTDIIFVAVQTPHQPEFDGTQRLTNKRADFDYTYLKQACEDIAPHVRPEQTVAIISTVLPGTMRREILPIFKGKCFVVYNPFFIAMGSVMKDFDNPEFILMGTEKEGLGVARLKNFYSDYHFIKNYGEGVPQIVMSYESAELTKVGYNLFISQKITYANALMEIAHKTLGCNIDDVTNALCKATDRIISPKYMNGGMVDGGACLTGGTKISLLNGEEIPIRDLVGIPEFYVYSYDLKTQRIVPGRGHSCRLTKKNARVYEVRLDNGRKIRCTGDHPFLLRNGKYKEASELRVGERLMPLYRRENIEGYEQCYHPICGGWVFTHRLVYSWKYGEKSSNIRHSHHKDHNKRNNDPSNIRSLSSSKHASHHNNQPDRLKQSSEVMTKNNEEGKTNTPEQNERKRICNIIDNPMKDPEARKKTSRKMKRIMRKRVREGTHHTVINNPVHKLIEEGRHNFLTDHPMKDAGIKEQMVGNLNEFYSKRAGFHSYEQSRKIIRRLRFTEGLKIDEIMEKLNVSRRFVYYRLKDGANHTVESVEYLGRRDVYNFEVDEYENYALSSGIFVHNCHPRDCIAMSWLSNIEGVRANLFDKIMQCREEQTEWLARLFVREAGDLPKVLLGKAFKPGTNITAGSPAILLANMLREWGVEFEHYDPYVDVTKTFSSYPWAWRSSAFFIATKHDRFRDWKFPPGCIVIDPHRYISDQPGVKVIRMGEGK